MTDIETLISEAAYNRDLTYAKDFNGRAYALMDADWIGYFDTLDEIIEYLDISVEKDDPNKIIERNKAINEWLSTHCKTCAENLDRGTEFVNCQSECEIPKDVGIACIHYEEYVVEDDVNSERML